MEGATRKSIISMRLPKFFLSNLEFCSENMVNILNNDDLAQFNWDAVLTGDFNSSYCMLTFERSDEENSKSVVNHVTSDYCDLMFS